jgi:hypothetical protein
MKRVFLCLNLVALCAMSLTGNNCKAQEEKPTGVALAQQTDNWFDWDVDWTDKSYEALMGFCRAKIGEIQGEVLHGCYPNVGKAIQSAITNAYYANNFKVRCYGVVQYSCVRPEDYFSTTSPAKSKAPSAPRYLGAAN